MIVSARHAPPPPYPFIPEQVIATDDQGTEWWLTEDSQWGDWVAFLEKGGTIDPYEPPP